MRRHRPLHACHPLHAAANVSPPMKVLTRRFRSQHSVNFCYVGHTPGSTAEATNFGIFANPRFGSASDYHLQKGSPAMGVGIRFDYFATDFDAKPRRNPPAIGAYK
jgi:hypothetical protein